MVMLTSYMALHNTTSRYLGPLIRVAGVAGWLALCCRWQCSPFVYTVGSKVFPVPFTPTHRDGGTLDLVITKSVQILGKITLNPPGVISDHSVISWHCPLDIQPTAIMKREVRGWTRLDLEGFRAALLTSELCNSCSEKRSRYQIVQLNQSINHGFLEWSK